MITKWKLTYPAYTGDEPRTAYVYVPNAARKHPERRYPVLYMFDGHNVFFDADATYGKSWGMKKYMDRTHTPMIIAAIECNHSPSGGRLSEYSPFTVKGTEVGDIKGRGEETMEWLVNTFKPEIDKRFPTIPDREHTFIAGSSMGGLMSLYAVLQYNAVFGRAACLSPSLWVEGAQMDALIRTAEIAPDTVVYMDYGANELSNHKAMAEHFTRSVGLLLQRHVQLSCRIVPHGDHCEACWEKQIPFFMHTLLYEV
ncbi:MAG: alpha/beta hydrolase [Clostridia bacterium]|nr:alpha/beta hydrolase [Clostridia bacterium]